MPTASTFDSFAFDAAPFDAAAAGTGPPPPPKYRPPAPTGWKSTARRAGPDPSFGRAARPAGQGE